MKGYLSELRSYEDSNELKKPEEFEKLIDRICKELPDEYSEKIKSIRFYQKQEDYEGLDDLPF
ncbi:hypothetical protein [Ekhidna sp. To15]|uniref:hypothetical protein n=1 Tax=Ekhidna sp. To15 TaxID=3395267 RepID=UPI003F51D5E0